MKKRNETHPLKVYYPLGGEHFMLRWWTEDDQNHIILARSQLSLNTVAERIFTKHHRYMCIKDMYRIDIVAPPNSLCRKAVKLQQQGDIDNFFQDVAARVPDDAIATNDLPRVFARCKNYNKEKYHDCHNKNCYYGVVLKDMTKKEFYKKYHERWYALYPKMYGFAPDVLKCQVYSQAEHQAYDGHVLWAAAADPGHHNRGVDLRQIREKDFWPEVMLFYYRMPEQLECDDLKKKLTSIIDKDIEQAKKSAEANRQKFALERMKQMREFAEFFEEK